MARRRPKYPEKPWHPDRARWKGFMVKGDVAKRDVPNEPKGGWQLWDWKTLKGVDQKENYQR